MNNKNGLRSGFTLAETLITITIIGVVMALMLRAINRVNPDKDKIQFIKAYHATEAVIADIINDPKKYDQTYYTDKELEEMAAADRHVDFRYSPFETAKVTYIDALGNEVTKGVYYENGAKKGSGMSKDEAMCYFLADQMNTIGGVNCENNNGIKIDGKTVKGVNFRTSTGVCFDNWNGVNEKGFNNPVIDPNCTGPTTGYVIHIYKDGKMTVPDEAAMKAQGGGSIDDQNKAFNWMQNQASLNDNK